MDGAGADVVKESKAGIVCSPDDPEQLSEAVLQMYNMSDEKRKQMGMNGKQYFETFFEGEMLVSKLEMWMKEVSEYGTDE